MGTVPTKVALVVGAAATVALLAWMAWQSSAQTSTVAVTSAEPSPESPPANITAANESASPLAADAGGAPQALAPSPTATTPTDDGDANTPPEPASAVDSKHYATVVLKGTIRSPRSDFQYARVEVRTSMHEVDDPRIDSVTGRGDNTDHSRSISLFSEADLSFEVDVSWLVHVFGYPGITRTLVIVAHGPHLISAPVKLSFPSEERLLSESHIELTTVIDMQSSVVRLFGQARTVDDVPASILVAPLTDGECGGGICKTVASVGKDDGFTFEVDSPVDYTIVALAEGYRPCTLRISTAPGHDVVLPTLVLEHGHTIRGRVHLGEKIPVHAVAISAKLSGSPVLTQVGGKALAWFGDSFEWANRSGSVDPSGDYELSALGPRLYSVSIGGAQVEQLGRVQPRDFVAPCTGADISVGPACEVQLVFNRLRDQRGITFGVRQQFSGGGGGYATHQTASNGFATLILEPETTATIEVGGRVFQVPPCTSGGSVEMRIDL